MAVRDGRKIATLDLPISTCMQRWITKREDGGGKAPPKHHIRQLKAYLRSDKLSPEKKSKPIEPNYTKQLPRERALTAGDPTLGSTVFRKSCITCHATDGSGPAPSLLRNGYSRYQIAKKIREIDNVGLEGLIMPPFPKDRLSDRQLINVIAFVYQM
jgi:mono/diheme cytochrome c family protein